MSQAKERQIRSAIKADLSKCKSVFNGQKVKIHKGFKLSDGQYDLIIFKNGTNVINKVASHTTYIEFGDYLISVSSPNIKEVDALDFSTCSIYNISTGIELSKGYSDLGTQKKSNLIIVDSRILVTVAEKSVPKFYIIVNGHFEEIEASLAEHLLNIADFTKENVASLLKFYPDGNWEVHNGLVINPSCGYLPGQIQLEIWKRARHVNANIKKGINPDKLLSVFAPSTRSSIRYVSMANI